MPDTDSNRKRSRSASDSEPPPKQHKRANTGTTANPDDSTNNESAGSAHNHDVTMSETHHASASTPPTISASETTNKKSDSRDARSDTTDDRGKSSATASGAQSSSTSAPAPSAMIHMRCLIVTQDASIIIGKGGSHVNEIREKSGARVMVSESIPGNPERILNVSGPLDAVSKVSLKRSILFILIFYHQAFGLIVRRINDEPFDVPSVPGSRAVTIKFMIPNSRMGSVIGKQGSKIKEIQDASGARLNASEGMLPGSTEVRFIIYNVPDIVLTFS